LAPGVSGAYRASWFRCKRSRRQPPGEKAETAIVKKAPPGEGGAFARRPVAFPAKDRTRRPALLHLVPGIAAAQTRNLRGCTGTRGNMIGLALGSCAARLYRPTQDAPRSAAARPSRHRLPGRVYLPPCGAVSNRPSLLAKTAHRENWIVFWLRFPSKNLACLPSRQLIRDSTIAG
jgi:hypothetical protein